MPVTPYRLRGRFATEEQVRRAVARAVFAALDHDRCKTKHPPEEPCPADKPLAK